MSQSLFYTIADHLIEIVSTDAELTKKSLPNFDPFWIPSDNIKTQETPLFTFSTNRQIAIPDKEPSSVFSSEIIRLKFYETHNGKIAHAEMNGVERILKIDADRKHFETNLTFAGRDEFFLQKRFLTAAFGMAASAYKTIQLHASAIEKNGKALLFLGPSGTGKSTHSRLWLQHVPGSSLLNDDDPMIRILDNDDVRAYGTPWSGSTPCYRNASAQLAGFVHLYQSSENKLTQLSGAQALAEVMKHCGTIKWDDKMKQTIFSTLAEMLSSVPIYRLHCRPDEEAVALTSALIQ
jgi:hypothetical protein